MLRSTECEIILRHQSMQIVIGGAGEVGFNLAKYLSRVGHSITVIDVDEKLIKKINEQLEVKAIRGHASHPDVLKRAGLENADMLIAVTQYDETNIVACEIAHALFKVPKKIARIRSKSYLAQAGFGLFSDSNVAIDHVISPEIEVAQALSRNFSVPGAFEIIPLADGHARLLGVRCHFDTPIVNTPILHIGSLFPDVDFSIVGIVRGDQYIVPDQREVLKEGDEVYYVCAQDKVMDTLMTFGYTGEPTRKLVIIGGGNVGLYLAQEIEAHFSKIKSQIVELDKDRAEEIAQILKKTIVINGDALEVDTLREAGVEVADTVVCVTDDDRVNTLTSVIAQRMGAKKSLVLANKSSFANLVISLGAEAVINPRGVTVSRILQYIRKSKMHSVHSLGEHLGELVDVDASVATALAGRRVDELRYDLGVHVAAILRADRLIIPGNRVTIEVKDRVILMLPSQVAKDSENRLGID